MLTLRRRSEINQRVAAALATECGAPYQGILYGGFMATRDGVKLIEYNARFGDPESLNLLPLLETDFVAICRAIVDTTLACLCCEFLAEGQRLQVRRARGLSGQSAQGRWIAAAGGVARRESQRI